MLSAIMEPLLALTDVLHGESKHCMAVTWDCTGDIHYDQSGGAGAPSITHPRQIPAPFRGIMILL